MKGSESKKREADTTFNSDVQQAKAFVSERDKIRQKLYKRLMAEYEARTLYKVVIEQRETVVKSKQSAEGSYDQFILEKDIIGLRP